MHTTGIVLTIIGGAIAWLSAVALSCIKSDQDVSASEIFDVFILGGFITFFRGLFRGISSGVKNRTSAAFPLVILLSSGIAIFAIGTLLL